MTKDIISELAFNDFDGSARPGNASTEPLADAWVREILRAWRTYDTEARSEIDRLGEDEAARQYSAAWAKFHAEHAAAVRLSVTATVYAEKVARQATRIGEKSRTGRIGGIGDRTVAPAAAIAEHAPMTPPMTPEQIREKLRRRRQQAQATGAKSVALELADRMRLLIAFRDTGDEEGFEHELAEIRKAITEHGGTESAAARLDATLRRLGAHRRAEHPPADWQENVWKKIEAQAPRTPSRWAQRALLAVVFLGAIVTVYLIWSAL